MHKITVVIIVLAVLSLTAPQASLAASHGGGGKAKAVEVTPAMLSQGKAVYEKNCAACHGSGVAGAPKFGDKAVWKEHLAHGYDHMAEAVIRGKGAMPPRGGNPKLSDAEIRAAVAYVMENSR